MSKNQAILLTPAGPAAIAVVRIVGPAVSRFLADHFKGRPAVGRTVHGNLFDGDRVLDDPVVVLLNDQKADLNLHGGPWVVRATLELLGQCGFEQTPAGELPLPTAAVDAVSSADGDELLWQEVLTHLPLARTELATRALLAQPAAWKAFLASQPATAECQRALGDRTMERLLEPARVAIVGPANVGKSTLANQLFGRERSITADLPGTTRDWVGELANLNGVAVLLVDTPGLRQTTDAIEQAAIERSRDQVKAADAVVVVLDATRPLDDEQQNALALHPEAIVAINKTDAPMAWEPSAIGGRTTIQIAARLAKGIDELSAAILQRLGCQSLAVDQIRCWTERQRELLANLASSS